MVKTKTVDTIFTITYHPALSSITSIVKKHHKVMSDEDPILRRCFSKPSVVAYKRPKNLRDLLVKSKFQSGRRSDRILNGFSRCTQLLPEAEFFSLLWSIKLFQKIKIFTVFYYLYLKLCLMKIINKYKL